MEEINEAHICTILDKQINHDEINLKLYERAFTHKSATKNHSLCNERLEFVGDAVLNLIVGHYLYEKYPDENEGFLTRIRTKLVSGKNLSSLAKSLDFNKFIKMNDRGMQKEWYNNPRILEDAFESFIGALFLDKGFEICKQFILKHIECEDEEEFTKDTNYKDILMKFTQSKSLGVPEYKIFKEDGPDHNKIFIVQVYANKLLLSNGRSNTKKDAEQKAAKAALECLQMV